MSGLLEQQLTGLILFLCASLLVAVTNWFSLRRLGEYQLSAPWPRVSVLVPARNEENNIGLCVASLLMQDYPDLQVVVLDDESSDGTREIISGLAAQDERLQFVEGKALPPGWLGKNWACSQLAEEADGEFFLFTDADTRHQPNAVSDAVAALRAERGDLLSILPLELVCTWAERLLVPVIHWSVFSFFPFAVSRRIKTPVLAVAIGQFLLFRREAYEHIGGHAAVQSHAADDIALARKLKAAGFRVLLADGSRHVHCRMYQNANEAIEGLTKNLFAAFDYRLGVFIFVWLWLGLVFLAPISIVVSGIAGIKVGPDAFRLAIAAVAASVLLWGLTCWRFRFPRLLAFIYPIIMLLAMGIAARSWAMTRFGRTTWKGRNLQPGYKAATDN